MNENPKRPAAVWIAIVIHCLVGIFVLSFNAIVVYTIVNAASGSPSTKDTIIIAGFGLISLICFGCAFLALWRFKVSRYLPLISVVIVAAFFLDIFLNVKSFEGTGERAVLIGLLVFVSMILFFTLLPSFLLSFGKAVNTYFGIPSENEDSDHGDPPPPPQTF